MVIIFYTFFIAKHWTLRRSSRCFLALFSLSFSPEAKRSFQAIITTYALLSSSLSSLFRRSRR